MDRGRTAAAAAGSSAVADAASACDHCGAAPRGHELLAGSGSAREGGGKGAGPVHVQVAEQSHEQGKAAARGLPFTCR